MGSSLLVDSVLHPTDFSEGSEPAFLHALALALAGSTRLVLLHAGTDHRGEGEWTRFPRVRETLERWGVLPPGSPKSAVLRDLNVAVEKVGVRNRDPLDAILGYLESHPVGLMVLATEGRDGLPRWIRRSVAERAARRSQTPTLFVPHGARGFVSPRDGRIALGHVLFPIDSDPPAAPVAPLVSELARRWGDGSALITALHVGPSGRVCDFELPDGPGCEWRRSVREGDVVEEITAAARSADLIAMLTRGREGALDVLRGSTTERVIRHAPCPVLAIPARGGDAA